MKSPIIEDICKVTSNDEKDKIDFKQNQHSSPVGRQKFKRDIINFSGENPVAINLEHVSGMRLDGKTILFDFYTKTQPIKMSDEESATSVYQSLLNIWCGEPFNDQK